MFSIQVEAVFASEAGMLRVKVLLSDIDGGYPGHPTALDITLPFPEGFYRSPKHERGENSNPDRR